MKAVTIKAHYDGKQVCFDEPCHLAPDTRLLVTVISGDTIEDERMAWLAASQANFARAYGDDEPDYSTAALREEPPRQ